MVKTWLLMVIKRGGTLTTSLGGTGAGSGAPLMSPKVSERASKADEVPSDIFNKQKVSIEGKCENV